MQNYSQSDIKWSRENIGNTKIILGRYGCTITSICMLYSKFYEDEYTPLQAARDFKFTPNGLIIWNETEFKGMKFVERGYGFNKRKIKEYAEGDESGVILQVNYTHWVAVKCWKDTWLPTIIDPINSKEYENLPRWYRVTGYTLFQKSNNINYDDI